MTKRRVEVDDETYTKHPILANHKLGQTCDKKILDRNENVLEDALAGHCKVMMFRYDVRFPDSADCDDSNRLFVKGQADFVKYLNRKNLAPSYVAVREKSNDGGNHYHAFMCVDGSKTKKPYKHLKKAEEIFERKFGLEPDGSHGVVNFCNRNRQGKTTPNSYIIHKGKKKEFDTAFKRASYLAKVSTKPDDGGREMFASVRKKALK